MQSLTLHCHPGPNPWKVALILEELSLPYKTKIWTTAEQKKPPFTTTLNPNGFSPVIEDPNTGIKLWESGAIIEYLLETYDVNHSVSFPLSSAHDRGLLRQYHYFQATFQGPNLSAALYFTNAAPNTEARKRFVTESIRVLGVLENALGGDRPEKRKEWLVGEKCTAADLAFAPYILMSMDFVLGADTPDLPKEFPNVSGWVERMAKRPSVQKVLVDRKEAVASLSAPKAGTN